MAERGGNLRCTSIALLSAWVVMAFGTSALLVLAGLAGAGGAPGLSGFLAATWRVTDEVGPAAKLLLIAILPRWCWRRSAWCGRLRPGSGMP